MEARKYGMATGIGAFLFCLCALICVPRHHIIGLIASIAVGFASGYLSYEFRDVLRAIPKAAMFAGKGILIVLLAPFAIIFKLGSLVRQYFAKPHPVIFQSLLLGTLLTFPIVRVFANRATLELESVLIWLMLSSLYLGMGAVVAWAFVILPLALIGSRIAEKQCWLPLDGEYWVAETLRDKERWIETRKIAGLTAVSVTHANLFRWQVKGLGLVLKFIFWTMWQYLAIAAVVVMWVAILGAIALATFLPRFVIELLRLIHSPPRFVCGVYGTVGGFVSYLAFFARANTPAEKAMFLVCGAVFGGALGLAGRNLVMKRLLHIPIAVAQTNKP